MSDYLIHYGVKGMKWGIRKQRPTSGHSRLHRAYKAQLRDAADLRKHGYIEEANAVEQVAQNTKRKIEKKEAKRSSGGMSTGKKVAIGAAIVGGTLLAVYGAKKIHAKDVSRRVEKVRKEMEQYDKTSGTSIKNIISKAQNKSTAEIMRNKSVLNRMDYENSLYSKYRLKNMKYGSGRPYTVEQLKAMGIETFEPERIQIDTIPINQIRRR